MSNGQVCCILGVCCPPGSPAQVEALTAWVREMRPALDDTAATAIAEHVLGVHAHFADLAAALGPEPPPAA